MPYHQTLKPSIWEIDMFDAWLDAVTSEDTAKLDALFSDDFVMTSIRSGNTYDRTTVLDWYASNTNEVTECLFEDDSILVLQGRDTNGDGETHAYMDYFEHDGQRITSAKVVVAKAE